MLYVDAEVAWGGFGRVCRTGTLGRCRSINEPYGRWRGEPVAERDRGVILCILLRRYNTAEAEVPPESPALGQVAAWQQGCGVEPIEFVGISGLLSGTQKGARVLAIQQLGVWGLAPSVVGLAGHRAVGVDDPYAAAHSARAAHSAHSLLVAARAHATQLLGVHGGGGLAGV